MGRCTRRRALPPASTCRWHWWRRIAGTRVAQSVARELVVFLQRQGGQPQLSATLPRKAADREPLRELQRWLPDHLDEVAGVGDMAAAANMSPRNFSRLFKREIGLTPGEYSHACAEAAAGGSSRVRESGFRSLHRLDSGSARSMQRSLKKAARRKPNKHDDVQTHSPHIRWRHDDARRGCRRRSSSWREEAHDRTRSSFTGMDQSTSPARSPSAASRKANCTSWRSNGRPSRITRARLDTAGRDCRCAPAGCPAPSRWPGPEALMRRTRARDDPPPRRTRPHRVLGVHRSIALWSGGDSARSCATTHWSAFELLQYFGATPVSERVVIDGNIVTAAGVTAGIDGALETRRDVAR